MTVTHQNPCLCFPGQLELAQDHYEEFYHMTLGREWQDTSGCSHHDRSCEELGRVYTLLAERLLQKQDCELAVKMLTKAYEMAKECMHSNTRVVCKNCDLK